MNQYQERVIGFLSQASKNDQLVNSSLGLSGESGEVADLVKKHLHHGHDLDIDKLKLELGDVLFYVAEGADAIGCTLQEIADANIAKLSARYPNGYFTVEDSKAKKDEHPSLEIAIEDVRKESGEVAVLDQLQEQSGIFEELDNYYLTLEDPTSGTTWDIGTISIKDNKTQQVLHMLEIPNGTWYVPYGQYIPSGLRISGEN